MKIAITGGAGFIGQNLLKKFKVEDIVIIDDIKYRRKFRDYKYLDYNKILKSDNYSFVKDVDFIYHLGANSSTRASLVELYPSNIIFSTKLFIEANLNDVPVIFASSGAIYGSDRRQGDGLPLTQYGYTKYSCEIFLRYFPNLYQNIVSLRFHNVYGQFEDKKMDMASIPYKWTTGKKQVLFLDSKNIKRDFIHVDDICDVLNVFFIYFKKHKKLPNNKFYDVGTGNSVSFKDLGEEIDKHTKRGIEYIKNPYKKEEYQYFTQANIRDLKKVYKDLGKIYKPMDYKEGIKDLYLFKNKK
jgi:nucleoside-diphosphate-sugar epimerase